MHSAGIDPVGIAAPRVGHPTFNLPKRCITLSYILWMFRGPF
jgi:hypothetical protein